jgi:hypothetical protein
MSTVWELTEVHHTSRNHTLPLDTSYYNFALAKERKNLFLSSPYFYLNTTYKVITYLKYLKAMCQAIYGQAQTDDLLHLKNQFFCFFTLVSDMASNTADDRFYTPRSSARRGYSSTGSEDERFFSPRESARSVSSDDNDYVTPRELSSSSIQTFPASEYKQNSSTIGYSYQQGHYNMTEMKNAYPDYEPNGYDNNSNSHHQYSQPQYYPQKYDPDYKDHQYHGYSDDHKKDAKQHHHYEYDQYGYETRSAQYVESHFSVPENDIFSATRHNRIDSVTYMLDQGVSVNSKDEYGNTILSIACQNGLKRMAKLALRRGANINSQNVSYHRIHSFFILCTLSYIQ